MRIIPQDFRNTFDIFKRYWMAYGGSNALFKSPYLYSAIFISGISFSLWTKSGWWDLPISILPNLIGFTLGGYAVWLSFGDIKFRSWLCKSRGNTASIFMKVNASFVHFIVIQVLSLLYAIIAKSLPVFHIAYIFNRFRDPSSMAFWSYCPVGMFIKIGAFTGFCLFIYSILCGLAATMAVFRFSSWLEWHTLNPPRIRGARKRVIIKPSTERQKK